jgi:hypothetical protein
MKVHGNLINVEYAFAVFPTGIAATLESFRSALAKAFESA